MLIWLLDLLAQQIWKCRDPKMEKLLSISMNQQLLLVVVHLYEVVIFDPLLYEKWALKRYCVER